VRALTSYGAFVDLGGVTGLLHVSDMGEFQGRRRADVMAIGDEVLVSVVLYKPETQRIGLALQRVVGRRGG
jgi:small subunit ribosomal protein S1